MVGKSKGISLIDIYGLFGVVLIALKLLGIIDSSWLLVTFPFWGGLVLFAAYFVIAMTVKSRGP